ncbi:MAG: acyl-CoA thioesterase [Streptosporangiaceae bacterium]|nr:acyl-CoA thioesterase [Streptosporangiaceae bacterium]
MDDPPAGRVASGPPAGRSRVSDILDLERLGAGLFRGRSGWGSSTRVFGGEVAGQALMAAGRTVPDQRRVHSLHAYFLRPGDSSEPIDYQVDPIRDGGSFTTRRTVALQRGEPIFHLSASFHMEEDGYDHQVPHLDAPPPEDLPPAEVTIAEADEATRAWFAAGLGNFPFDLRFAEELPRIATMRGEAGAPAHRFWFRSAERLPDTPLLHDCALTYASDILLLASALPPHRTVIGSPGLQFASLDHAVWTHARFRADDWLFYQQEGAWAGGARALCRGSLFDRSGRLVASVMQEGLIRPRRDRAR